MGCVSSHPLLPPSPMPHTSSGPPPRPILTARAHTFYDIPGPNPHHDGGSDSAPPPLPAKAPRSHQKLERRKAATWDIAPHSKVVGRERSPPGIAGGMVQRSDGGLMLGGGGGARGKKGMGKGKGGYVGLEGEKREKEKKGQEEGQWHNRMKVGKEGEVWFF